MQAVTDANGRPIRVFVTAGQVGDDTGAAALPGSLPATARLIAELGYDADWFGNTLKDKGIRPFGADLIPCIQSDRPSPPAGSPAAHPPATTGAATHGATGSKSWSARLKASRRLATCDDRCPRVFLSAVVPAETVLFWL